MAETGRCARSVQYRYLGTDEANHNRRSKMKTFKGISKLPNWAQYNIKKRFLDNPQVHKIEVNRVSKDERFQPDLYDAILVIGWDDPSRLGEHRIEDVAEYRIGIPTFERFWAVHTA